MIQNQTLPQNIISFEFFLFNLVLFLVFCYESLPGSKVKHWKQYQKNHFPMLFILSIFNYLGLLLLNAVNCKTSFDVVQKTEVLIGLLNRNNIWNMKGIHYPSAQIQNKFIRICSVLVLWDISRPLYNLFKDSWKHWKVKTKVLIPLHFWS